MAALEAILGSTVVGKDGKDIDVKSLAGEGKVIGIYFSAHWCPPCRGFTPELAKFYLKMKELGKQLEIVFVSSDRDQASFDEYYGTMPWLALKFSDREQKEELGNKYGVRGIPTLVLIDGATGETIKGNARSNVVQDPNGDSFPWKE